MEWKPVSEKPITFKESFGFRSKPIIVFGKGGWARGECVGCSLEELKFITTPLIPIGEITHWMEIESPKE